MTPSPMRLLIAGCGDLGLHVTRVVLKEPQHLVWGLRRSIDAHIQPGSGFSWCQVDICKPETLSELPQAITHILFCAAPNVRTELEYRNVYLSGLQNLVQRAQNPCLERILFVSSTAVYGDHGNEWVDENTPVHPQHFNGRVLLESEQWLTEFGRLHGIKTLSLRLSGIYGPGRMSLLEKLRLGQAGAPSTPQHWANRIHVEDAANAIVHLMHYPQPLDTYVITDSTPLPLRQLYETLAKYVGGPVPPETHAPSMVGSKRLSNARLRASGFTFKWPDSRDGYASMI